MAWGEQHSTCRVFKGADASVKKGVRSATRAINCVTDAGGSAEEDLREARCRCCN